MTVKNASIKHQASRGYFYGEDGEIESAFQDLESTWAPLVNRIRKTNQLSLTSEEFGSLLLLMSLQHLRTPHTAASVATLMEGFLNTIYREQIGDTGLRIGVENPESFVLRKVDVFTQAIADLEPMLLIPPKGHHFVTSDNPVVLYNKLCEGIEFAGVTGAASAGLIMFLPLSPKLTLVLCDLFTYRLTGNYTLPVVRITRSDTRGLNFLQFVGADKVVYFRNEGQSRYLQKLNIECSTFRSRERAKVNEQVISATSSLVHGYRVQPSMDLSLSYLQVRDEFVDLLPTIRQRMRRPDAQVPIR